MKSVAKKVRIFIVTSRSVLPFAANCRITMLPQRPIFFSRGEGNWGDLFLMSSKFWQNSVNVPVSGKGGVNLKYVIKYLFEIILCYSFCKFNSFSLF